MCCVCTHISAHNRSNLFSINVFVWIFIARIINQIETTVCVCEDGDDGANRSTNRSITFMNGIDDSDYC